MDLSAEETGDFTADRQPQPGAAILAAGGAVGLLERFEDQLLLVFGNPDAGIDDRKGKDILRLAQNFTLELHGFVRHLDLQDDLPLLGKLKGVGEKVLEHLLQTLLVGFERFGKLRRIHLNLEPQSFLLRHLPETPLDVILHQGERNRLRHHPHLSRFHLGEIEDLVDQRQQVRPRRVDGLSVLDLFGG